jgi:MYXO-CTERM domain-containing protein
VDEGTRQGDPVVEGQGQRGPEEIREHIEQTRREVGDTAAALAEKADVKSQAKAKFEDVKSRVGSKGADSVERVKQNAPEPVKRAATSVSTTAQKHPKRMRIAAAAAVAGLLLGWLMRRR